MSFTNVYYKRTAGTERPCFVCYKPTTTVLATINTVDFLYACDTHLTDRNFASLIEVEDVNAKKAVSAEEIAKVKEEWEKKEKEKKEKQKEKEKEKDKQKDEDKDDKGEKEESKKTTTTKSMPASPVPASSPTPQSRPKYALHRDFFAMRQYEHKKKRQTTQAKALAPRLPGAPSGAVG